MRSDMVEVQGPKARGRAGRVVRTGTIWWVSSGALAAALVLTGCAEFPERNPADATAGDAMAADATATDAVTDAAAVDAAKTDSTAADAALVDSAAADASAGSATDGAAPADAAPAEIDADLDGAAEVDAETADAATADAATADAETADAETADAETADAETADAETADAETADAATADATSGDATPDDAAPADAASDPPEVDDVEPRVAALDEMTDFVVRGARLPDALTLTVDACEGVSALERRPERQRFRCTPRGGPGLHPGVVRDRPGGARLFEFEVEYRAACVPADEVCDGIDNDCDGTADENVAPRPAPLTEGVCAGTIVACIGGRYADPSYPEGYEADEASCDGLDNDCDGFVDRAHGGGVLASCVADLVLFESGVFEMGSPLDDPDREPHEEPHLVTISHRFWLGRAEVTRAEWSALLDTEPWRSSCSGSTCPVENVNWFDAVAWANARSRREGLEACYRLERCNGNRPGEDLECETVVEAGIGCEGYRLPTEAEWEYAARSGGDSRRFPWGNEPATCARAVMIEDEGGCGTGRSQRVCTKPEAPDGMCDVAGNLLEWVEDWYGPYSQAPDDGTARLDPAAARVYRGGSWSGHAADMRTAYRYRLSPGESLEHTLGFRIARTALPRCVNAGASELCQPADGVDTDCNGVADDVPYLRELSGPDGALGAPWAVRAGGWDVTDGQLIVRGGNAPHPAATREVGTLEQFAALFEFSLDATAFRPVFGVNVNPGDDLSVTRAHGVVVSLGSDAATLVATCGQVRSDVEVPVHLRAPGERLRLLIERLDGPVRVTLWRASDPKPPWPSAWLPDCAAADMGSAIGLAGDVTGGIPQSMHVHGIALDGRHCGGGREHTEDLVAFEPGVFQMGSPAAEPFRNPDEAQHEVTILHRFWLQRAEVTRAEWRALLGTEPWRSNCVGDDCPVEFVNWYEAAAWANARSQAEGLEPCYRLEQCNGSEPGEGLECAQVQEVGIGCPGYRLPTEAEWEYAAREGGQDRRYPWGEEAATCQRAVMDDDQPGCGAGGPLPVCSKPEAPDGLCDLSGNVWEWVEDWHGDYAQAPEDGSARLARSDGRVNRGGSWLVPARNLRTAARNGSQVTQRHESLGLRVARTILPDQ